MVQLIVTTRNGSTQTLDAAPNVTAMEAIRDSGIGDLLALCGGVCSCATCHVYVDAASEKLLPPKSADESEMLEYSPHHQDNSRLSCQIRMSEELSGLKLTIAPED